MQAMKRFLRGEGHGLNIACALYCFYVVWTGETGSFLLGGIAMAWALLFVLSPAHLLPPLFAAVCLERNCSVVGMTASRYLTLLLIFAQGIAMLCQRRFPKKGMLYSAVLAAYFACSAVFSQAGYDIHLFTMFLNFALMYCVAHLPRQAQKQTISLLLVAGTAVVSYLIRAVITGVGLTIIQGRYWMLGQTNPNHIGMSLAQIALLFFAYGGWALWEKKWRNLCLAGTGYAVTLYLVVLTGSRSATVGIFGAMILTVGVMIIRAQSADMRKRFAVGALIVIAASAAITYAAIPTAEEVIATTPEEWLEMNGVEGNPESFGDLGVINRWEVSEAAQVGGFAGRFRIWDILWNHAIVPHPFFGVGFSYENTAVILREHGDTHSGAHNILFAVLTSLGAIGLLLLVIPVAVMLLKAAAFLRRQPLLLLGAAMVLGAIGNGVGEDMYTERVLWVAVGLCLWLLWELPDITKQYEGGLPIMNISHKMLNQREKR